MRNKKKTKQTRREKTTKKKEGKKEMLKKYADQDDNVALFCADLSVDFPGYTL